MGFNKNSGYVGWSMSRRAEEAYEGGEMPISKWSKKYIIESIRDEAGEEVAEKARTYPLKELRSLALYRSSWHHTGEFCRATDFYSVEDAETLAERFSKTYGEKLAEAEKRRLEEYKDMLERFSHMLESGGIIYYYDDGDTWQDYAVYSADNRYIGGWADSRIPQELRGGFTQLLRRAEELGRLRSDSDR